MCRDLGKRASPVNRAHMKGPYISYLLHSLSELLAFQAEPDQPGFSINYAEYPN